MRDDFIAGQYIRFQTREGQNIPARAYHNVFPNQSRVWSGVSYDFAPFIISGDFSSKNGDASQAELGTVLNGLTVPLLSEAVLGNWIIRVETVLLGRTGPTDPFVETGSLSVQIWPIKGASIEETEDEEEAGRVTVRLQGIYDAVNRQWPRGSLTSDRVGYLPPTGSIALS